MISFISLYDSLVHIIVHIFESQSKIHWGLHYVHVVNSFDGENHGP